MLAPGSPVNLNQAIIEPGGFKSRAHVSFGSNKMNRFAKVNEYEVPPGPLLFRAAINTFDENWRRDHLLCLSEMATCLFLWQFAALPSVVRNYDHKKSPDQQGSFLA